MKGPLSVRPKHSCDCRSKSGQAILESFAVILLLCLILFGMIQLVMMVTATEIIQFSADSAVRARAVGLNEFMALKSSVIASSPNAGERSAPYGQSRTSQAGWESARNAGQAFESSHRNVYNDTDDILYFPEYLETLNMGYAQARLNYTRSAHPVNSGNDHQISAPHFTFSGEMIRAVVTQDYPLTMPLFRAFSDSDSIYLRGEAELANHAELYLQ